MLKSVNICGVYRMDKEKCGAKNEWRKKVRIRDAGNDAKQLIGLCAAVVLPLPRNKLEKEKHVTSGFPPFFPTKLERAHVRSRCRERTTETTYKGKHRRRNFVDVKFCFSFLLIPSVLFTYHNSNKSIIIK